MMSTWLEKLGIFARAPDTRPASEVIADIDQELEFHLAERTAELQQQGWEPAAARAEAEHRFGDHARVRRECVKVQLGEKIMWQRIQGISMVIMMLTMVFVAFLLVRQNHALVAQQNQTAGTTHLLYPQLVNAKPNVLEYLTAHERNKVFVEGPYGLPDGRSSTRSAAVSAWRSELEEDPKDTRKTEEVASRLLALPDQRGIDILVDLSNDLSQEHFDPILKPLIKNLAQPGFLRAVEALVEAPERPSIAVLRGRRAVRAYSWHQTPSPEWYARWRDEEPAEVLRANAELFAMELQDLLGENITLNREHVEALECARADLYAAHQIDLGALLGKRVDPVALQAKAKVYNQRTQELMETVASWILESKKR